MKLTIILVITMARVASTHLMKDPMNQLEGKCGCCPEPCCCHCITNQQMTDTTTARPTTGTITTRFTTGTRTETTTEPTTTRFTTGTRTETTTTSTTTTTTPFIPICNSTLDICFIQDSRKSIGDENWPVALGFLNPIIDGFDIGIDATKVAMVTYAESVTVHWGFGSELNQDKKALQDAIAGFPLSNEPLSNVAKALKEATLNVLNTDEDRKETPNACIVVITGEDSSDPSELKEKARRLKESATVLVVGVTADVNMDVLREIASNENLIFTFDDIVLMMDILQDLVLTRCTERPERKTRDKRQVPTAALPTHSTSLPGMVNEECFCCCPPPPGYGYHHGYGYHYGYGYRHGYGHHHGYGYKHGYGNHRGCHC